MLISFTVDNWMSFCRSATYSMVATKERQHGDRLARVAKYPLRVLPVAAVYGGNASGKTSLFKALNFAKNLVVKGTQPEGLIAVEPFRLDPEAADRPCRFGFQILVEDTIYDLSFAVTRMAVVEEKLVEVLGTSERVLYHRIGDKPKFCRLLEKDDGLRFAFKGTRDNQLFLTNTVHQKIPNFKHIYDWFRHNLVLVAPDTRFGPLEMFIDEENPLHTTYNNLLAQLDTGIASLGGEDVEVDRLGLPEALKSRLAEEVPENATVTLRRDPENERIVMTRKGGELRARRLVARHENSQGELVRFDFRHESDGTQRAIDLVPGFLDLMSAGSRRAYVIDEIDRSLHTLLIRKLIEAYLDCCGPDSRTQLLFTTHDVLLSCFRSASTRTFVLTRISAKATCKAAWAVYPASC